MDVKKKDEFWEEERAAAREDLQAKLRIDTAKRRKHFGAGRGYAKEFSESYSAASDDSQGKHRFPAERRKHSGLSATELSYFVETYRKKDDKSEDEKAEIDVYAQDQLKEKGEWAAFEAKRRYHVQSLRERNENAANRRERVRQRAERLVEDIKKAAETIGLAGGWLILMLLIIVLMVGVIGAFFGTETEDGKSVAVDPVVGVAKMQVGQIGGEPYWKWYGFNSRVDWCAIFVSWCAEQCDYIDDGIMPKFSLVSDGMNWYKSKGRWDEGREIKYEVYTWTDEEGNAHAYVIQWAESLKVRPKDGDLIFFDWEIDPEQPGFGEPDHVGIVEVVKWGKVYTVEGNSGDACQTNEYRLSDLRIMGYGELVK